MSTILPRDAAGAPCIHPTQAVHGTYQWMAANTVSSSFLQESLYSFSEGA